MHLIWLCLLTRLVPLNAVAICLKQKFFLFRQESAPDEAERLSILNALRADAGRLLAEYESNNPAGNRLQRHLLNCEHAFQQLDERYLAIDIHSVVLRLKKHLQ